MASSSDSTTRSTGERLAPIGDALAARAVGPVLADALDELALGGDGVHDEVVAAAVGARAPREVVDVEVRHGGRDDGPLPVEHGVVHERDGEAPHVASSRLRARARSAPTGRAAARACARSPARGATARSRRGCPRRGPRGRARRGTRPGACTAGTRAGRPCRGLCDSSIVDASLPSTPGRRRAHASTTAIAATSPPVITKSPERDLLVDVRPHPLVEPLVAAADEHHRVAPRELAHLAPDRARAPAASAARGAPARPPGASASSDSMPRRGRRRA